MVAILRDKHVRTRPEELQRFREVGLRVFWIGGTKDLSTWDWLSRLVRHWDSMEDVIRTRGARPWFYVVNETGLSEVRVPG